MSYHPIMHIAVSSFGESLRRVTPHRSGGDDFNPLDIQTETSPSTGKTTVNVLPLPAADSSQIRPR